MVLPLVFSHPRCLDHDPGPGHPESPARLSRLLARLEAEPGATVQYAAPAPIEAILRVHPKQYLDCLAGWSARGGGALEADTILNCASWDAALGAAGAALAAVRHAHEGRGNAFAAIRPPGHHALREYAMGFCLLANAVIAAREVQALGRRRVLVVDWDVHHGNGTQALIEADRSVRFVSLHEWPAYPGTGSAGERGVGNVFNLPRAAGLPARRYVADLGGGIIVATEAWQPDFVVISAGYDSMLGDPLGGFTLQPPDYARVIDILRERCPDTPIVGLLEGGYAPARLAEGVVATLHALN